MGALIDNVGIKMLVYGDGLVENYKNNSIYFYNKFQGSDAVVTAINITDLISGYFYHFVYLDDSNWMKYCTVFMTDFKKVGNKIIIYGINMNFIPIEYRVLFFDKFIDDKVLEENRRINTTYEGAYNELKNIHFEYSLVEYDILLIKMVHRIDMSLVPRLLVSGDPMNKYDPKKLYEILEAKEKDRNKRDSEIKEVSVEDLYNIKSDMSDSYEVLKKHIQRIQNNQKKYANN